MMNLQSGVSLPNEPLFAGIGSPEAHGEPMKSRIDTPICGSEAHQRLTMSLSFPNRGSQAHTPYRGVRVSLWVSLYPLVISTGSDTPGSPVRRASGRLCKASLSLPSFAERPGLPGVDSDREQ